MRLPAEQVKDAILHPDKDVRTSAAFYFSHAFSPDATIMPVVIQAIESYGWNDAFRAYWFLARIVQTNETIGWLIDHVVEEDRCLLALRSADPAVLKPHESKLISLALEDREKEAISQRIRLMSMPPDQLWADLGVFCNEHEYDTLPDYVTEQSGFHLVEALGRHMDRFLGVGSSIKIGTNRRQPPARQDGEVWRDLPVEFVEPPDNPPSGRSIQP
jgi:hypothetical protein